jgi:nicotinamide-nucleotide amidase
MNAEIIGVGSELLLGQIANTDAQYLSQQLSGLGINVFFHTVVGDNAARLKEVLGLAHKRSDLIITTGGLGPTMDDLTKETVAEFLGLPMILDQKSLDGIHCLFHTRGWPLAPSNDKQAMFPKGAIILSNENGTAPGAIIEKDGRTYVILPGPPFELNPMFEKSVMPYLSKKTGYVIHSRVLKIYGMGESAVEESILDILEKQTNPTIAPLAKMGEVTLRLTVRCGKGEDAEALLRPVEEEIRARLGDIVYGVDDDTLASALINTLRANGKTLALAESCTGGLVSKMVTDVPGASDVFLEGIVTYSNEAKENRLDVHTVLQYGAVSPQTAGAMLKGLFATSDADIGAAVTGIAGPGGGTEEKPVGLVYIAIGDRKSHRVHTCSFHRDRERIRHAAAMFTLDQLRRWVNNS